MAEIKEKKPVVFTNKAECRDCYRCLRVCPVKAIKMDKGQASVDPDRCIACGTCIKECPQKAKAFRHDLARAQRLLGENNKVALSLAPSFASLYEEWQQKRLPSAFRRLGFSYVGETSVGAYQVARQSFALKKDTSFCTACPSFVSMVEKYYPELVKYLLPVASPMIVHGRMIKQKLGENCKIIFVGPCVAKKAEAEKTDAEGIIDVVLTFDELEEWFEAEKIQLDMLEASSFDDEPGGSSRLFPLPGGLTHTAGFESEGLTGNIVSVSGSQEIKNLLENMKNHPEACLVEPLFCSQGCINGPGMPVESGLFTRRNSIVSYNSNNPGIKTPVQQVDSRINYFPDQIGEEVEITEAGIKEVLAATGKIKPSDELDCGACGYDSCRDKAIAVLKGLAEVEMCIPYMRRLAEQRTDRIIETSPNGIVLLDEHLNIISMNPAFRKMFFCSEAGLGRHISYLVDPQPFEKILAGSSKLIEETVEHKKYSLVAHQIIYELEIEKQIVGIFVNITSSRKSREQLDRLRADMINQARDMLEHQIKMSQEIAGYLGENTAKSETLIENLVKLASEESRNDKKGKKSKWDIFTSK
jgi:PAS domain S-box-containing protein